MKRSHLVLACAALALFATTFFVLPKSDEPDLSSIDGLPEKLEDHYHICTDDPKGSVSQSFFVSKRPLTQKELNALYKNRQSRWDGVVWIADTSTSLASRWGTITVDKRLWGKVMIVGDPDLIDEIEDSITP